MDAGLGPPWERPEDQHLSSHCAEGQAAPCAASPPHLALPLPPRQGAVPGEQRWAQQKHLEDGYGEGKVQISVQNIWVKSQTMTRRWEYILFKGPRKGRRRYTASY